LLRKPYKGGARPTWYEKDLHLREKLQPQNTIEVITLEWLGDVELDKESINRKIACGTREEKLHYVTKSRIA